MMKKVFLNEFTGREIKEMLDNGKIDSAITIFGACESHGWHNPLGPDIFVPTEIAKRVAERLDKTVVVPGIPFGTSIHYDHFPLTISFDYSTTIKVAEDIFKSLIKYGIKHILILNGHDGNIPALEVAARNVKQIHKDASIIYVPAWWEITGEKMKNDFEVWDGLGHGGEGETSIMMAVNEDLVNLEDAVCQMPHDMINLSDHSSVIFDITEITTTGAIGDPTKATKEKGEKMLSIVVDYLVNLIKNLEENNWNYDYKK